MNRINHRLKGHIILEYGEQGRFAEAAGISPSTLSRVIHGHISLPHEERERWARLLNVGMQEVFAEENLG